MAQGQEDEKPLRPRARIDPGTDLHEEWIEWRKHFEHKSEATTAAIRRGLQDTDEVPERAELDRLVKRGIAVLMLTVVAVIVGQAYVISGGLAAAGLAGVAVVTAGVTMVAPLGRVF